MTNLSRLVVSLTKHGAHKVADLFDLVPPDDVIKNTWGKFPGINIDRAQARKVLSAHPDDTLPAIWHDANKAGQSTIKGLVLLAIVFSHHTVIRAMCDGNKGYCTGEILRGDIDGGKGFTNLKNDFMELGFTTHASQESFTFDVRSIANSPTLGPLALSLFRMKLGEAGWTEDNDIVDECVRLGFHSAFGMNDAQFRQWIGGASVNLDEIQEAKDPDETGGEGLIFNAGHSKRKTGEVATQGHGETVKARLLHNELQNKLYEHLISIHAASDVGTEQAGGPSQTSIDLVLRTPSGFVFYEIKTSSSLRKCLREAIPQLLEYAYWPQENRAIELIVVSLNGPTADSKKYLSHLRRKFSLPIYHETVDMSTGKLSSRI